MLTTFLLTAVAGAAACAPEAGGLREPASLADVQIPEGFDFATSQPLALRIETSHAVPGRVELRDPAGDLIYQGAVLPERPLVLDIAVAKGAERLEVSLVTGLERETASLEIGGGSASHRF